MWYPRKYSIAISTFSWFLVSQKYATLSPHSLHWSRNMCSITITQNVDPETSFLESPDISARAIKISTPLSHFEEIMQLYNIGSSLEVISEFLFKAENRFRPCYFLHQKFDLHGKKYHWSANGRVQSVAVYPSHPLLCSSYQTQSLSSCEESVFKKSWKSWNLIQHQLQFPQKWSKKRNQKWKKMLSMQWFHINLKSYLCQTAIIVFIAFQSLII